MDPKRLLKYVDIEGLACELLLMEVLDPAIRAVLPDQYEVFLPAVEAQLKTLVHNLVAKLKG